MKSEVFIEEIGNEHIVNVKDVSDKIDKLSDEEKSIISDINSEITDLLCKLKPEHHLLCIESNLIVIKYSQSLEKG